MKRRSNGLEFLYYTLLSIRQPAYDFNVTPNDYSDVTLPELSREKVADARAQHFSVSEPKNSSQPRVRCIYVPGN